jgi:hypothetical protein
MNSDTANPLLACREKSCRKIAALRFTSLLCPIVHATPRATILGVDLRRN